MIWKHTFVNAIYEQFKQYAILTCDTVCSHDNNVEVNLKLPPPPPVDSYFIPPTTFQQILIMLHSPVRIWHKKFILFSVLWRMHCRLQRSLAYWAGKQKAFYTFDLTKYNMLKSLKVAKWRKDEWWMNEGWMKNDEGWRLIDEGWWFQAVEGFRFLTDRLMDKRTNRHWWM